MAASCLTGEFGDRVGKSVASVDYSICHQPLGSLATAGDSVRIARNYSIKTGALVNMN